MNILKQKSLNALLRQKFLNTIKIEQILIALLKQNNTEHTPDMEKRKTKKNSVLERT